MLYQDIKSKLKKNRIFFTIKGEDRHTDDAVFKISRDLSIEPYVGFLRGNYLWSMGSFSYSHSILPVNSQVGRYCSIAAGVSVLGIRHPLEWLTTSSSTYDTNFSIFKNFLEDQKINKNTYNIRKLPQAERKNGLIIEHDVWIGANTVLKRNIIIGTGAVIAANSVVIKDVPPYAIVGGNPAKIIRYRFSSQQVEKLLEIQWWEYDFVNIQNLDIENIDKFIEQFQKLHKEWNLFKPKPLTFNDLI